MLLQINEQITLGISQLKILVTNKFPPPLTRCRSSKFNTTEISTFNPEYCTEENKRSLIEANTTHMKIEFKCLLACEHNTINLHADNYSTSEATHAFMQSTQTHTHRHYIKLISTND
jgi:hypothetical protein